MYLGGSIAMIAIGAILAFAVTDAVNGVDLTMVGYILMAAGALGIVLSLAVGRPRRETIVEDRRPPV